MCSGIALPPFARKAAPFFEGPPAGPMGFIPMHFLSYAGEFGRSFQDGGSRNRSCSDRLP